MATVSDKFRAKYGIESAANITIQSGGLTVQAGGVNLNGSGTLTGIGSTTVVTNLNADLLDGLHSSSFQSTDATLTAIAGLTPGADNYIYFTGTDVATTGTITSFGRSLVDDANAAAAQTTLSLVPGTDVQAYDATLNAMAGVTTAADRIIYFTGVDTATYTSLTSFGRTLIDDADNSAARTTLGLGTIATQAANSVAITGGTIEGTNIGASTAGTGRFSSLTTTGSATIGVDLTVTGNLTVQGDTVSLNVSTLNVEDNEVILNSNVSGTPALDALLTVERGTSTNVSIKWDEALDKWRYTNDGTNWYDIGTASSGLSVSQGGTGATTLTGYVYGNGTSPMTASTTIPGSAISSNISYNAVNVTGTVAIGNGGTGQTTKAAAFNALSPVTTLGDIIYGDGANSNARLGGNTSTTKQFLSQTGNGSASAAPAWSTVSKSDVGLGSVENTALSTWAGSANITTLGTISTGIWSGTAIGVAKGGTGLTATPTNGQLPIGNGINYTLATLTQGTGVTITNGSGSIQIGIAQAVATTDNPTFAGVYFGAISYDNAGTVTVTANTATVIDSWATATYTSAEYIVQMKQGTAMTTSKLLVLYDGTDVHYTEYSTLNATAGAANVTTLQPVLNGANIELQLTSPNAATTNIVCKVRRTLIKV